MLKLRPAGSKLRHGKAGLAAAAHAQAVQRLAKALRHLLLPVCPLFGRKVAADAMTRWAELLQPVIIAV